MTWMQLCGEGDGDVIDVSGAQRGLRQFYAESDQLPMIPEPLSDRVLLLFRTSGFAQRHNRVLGRPARVSSTRRTVHPC